MTVKKIFLLLSLVLVSSLAYSQEPKIDIFADKSEVDVSQDINVTITVEANSPDIEVSQLPSLPNFNIYSAGVTRRTTMSNSKVRSMQTFIFILSPRFAGKSTIGAFTVKVAGKEYKTGTLDVEVTRSSSGNAATSLSNRGSSAASKPAPKESASSQKTTKKGPNTAHTTPDFFMTARVDKNKVYLNEQMLLKIRFYQAKNTLSNPQYTRPKMEGLVFEEVKTNQGYETVGGRQYLYNEFVSALFGILPGSASVGPATVEYAVTSANTNEAFDLFFTGGSLSIVKKVSSDPIKIQVMPLPKEGKPQSFYGAVGTDYEINAQVDTKKPTAGEPITLTVTVSGNGNMRSITDIPAPDLGASFRVYETTSSSATKIADTTVGGTKVYKTVIVPRASGKFTIPGADFAYFDTEKREYKTLKAQDILLEVAPSTAAQSGASVSFTQDTASSARIERLTNDISYLKTGELSLFSKVTGFVSGLGALNYFAFIIILLTGISTFLDFENIPFFARRKAYIRAVRALNAARTMDDVSAALRGYLEAKHGPIGINTISDVIRKLKLKDSTSKDLEDLWQEFEMLKYAPAEALKNSIAASEASEKTLNLIKEIEKELK